MLDYNKNEDLSTLINSQELREKIFFIIGFNSYTSYYSFLMYLKGSKIFIENNENFIFNKELARKFIKENDFTNLKRKSRDKKINKLGVDFNEKK